LQTFFVPTGLQGEPDWTIEGIIELQTRVIRVLLYRRGRPGEGDK
jgi:hypothetical protein